MSESEPSDTLPHLEWLRVFEAAGRTGSFTAAAAELGLTQAAVSQRIRNLESRLGTRLFLRRPRGVALSAEGEADLPHVAGALNALRRSTTDLFTAPRRRLTLACPASVAQLWVAPRLVTLARRFPALQIAVVTVQRQTDYPAAEADFEVRFGGGAWPSRGAVRLYEERLAPVAAPALAEAGDWRRLPQIAVSGPRAGWREWAAAAGVAPPRPPSLRFDTFAQGLSAAVAGCGVLLGSLALLEQALAEGRLRRLAETALTMQEGYWLTWPETAAAFRERDALIACLTGPGPSGVPGTPLVRHPTCQ